MEMNQIDSILGGLCYVCATTDYYQDPSMSEDERLTYVVQDFAEKTTEKFGDDIPLFVYAEDEKDIPEVDGAYIILRYKENYVSSNAGEIKRRNKVVPWTYNVEYIDKENGLKRRASFPYGVIKNSKKSQAKLTKQATKKKKKSAIREDMKDDIDIVKDYIYGDSISDKKMDLHKKKSVIFSIVNSYEFDDIFNYLLQESYGGKNIPDSRNVHLLQRGNYSTVDDVRLDRIEDGLSANIKEAIRNRDALSAFKDLSLGKKKDVYSVEEYNKMLRTKAYIYRNNPEELTLSQYLDEILPKIKEEMISGDIHNRVHVENIIALGEAGELYKFKKITNINVSSDEVSFSVSLWNFPSNKVRYGHGLARYDTLGEHDNAIFSDKFVSGAVIKKKNLTIRPANSKLGSDANKLYHASAKAPHFHIMDPAISTTYLCKQNHTGNAVNVGELIDYANNGIESNEYVKNQLLVQRMITPKSIEILERVKELAERWKRFGSEFHKEDQKKGLATKKFDDNYFSLVKEYMVAVGDDLINQLFNIDNVPRNCAELQEIIDAKKIEVEAYRKEQVTKIHSLQDNEMERE